MLSFELMREKGWTMWSN